VGGASVDIVRRIEEAWRDDDLDALDGLIAEDFSAHTPGSEDVPGLSGAKMAHQQSLQAFPDRQNHIQDIFGEGNRAIARVRMTGTNTGGLPWFGIPANGAKVDIEWITEFRLEDGKVVETWAQMDLPTMMQQLGAMPGPTM
jgi:steroid delta-isomerase-like uncharacterized protein